MFPVFEMSTTIKGDNDKELNIDTLKVFFESSPLGVSIYHNEKVVFANSVFAKYIGFSPDEIIGRNISDLSSILEPTSKKPALEGLLELSRNKKMHDRNRYKFITAKGDVRFLEMTGTSIKISGKNYVIAYSDDVTIDERSREMTARERKAYGMIAEAALSIEPIESICQSVLEGLVETIEFDLGTIRLYREQDNILELIADTGLKHDELEIEIPLNSMSHLSARTARTKQPLFVSDITESKESKDRMLKPIRMGIRSLIFWPIIGSDKRLLGVINIASKKQMPLNQKDRIFFTTIADMFATIIERRNAEEQLRESQEQFIAFADNIPGPVYIKDHELKVIFVNQFMKNCSPRYFRDSMTNEDPFIQKHIEGQGEDDRRILTKGAIDQIQQILGKDGQTYTFRSHKFPIHREGKPPLIGGFSIDITEQVEAQKQREEARARAEFFNDLMSHDLNNMHQGIMASLELIIGDKALPEHLKDLAERALLQVNRSVSLISNVKKFSLVNQGELALEKTDPAVSLGVAIEMVKQSFPSRRIIVRSNLIKDKYCIMANEFLQDVFYNILHNAVKATESEDVNLEVESSLTEKGEFLRIDFVDYGMGIDDTLKDVMLLGFDELIRRVSGVGLTLVKQIINQYNGKISIENRVAGDYTKGSRFIIQLPYGC